MVFATPSCPLKSAPYSSSKISWIQFWGITTQTRVGSHLVWILTHSKSSLIKNIFDK
jgi:hypothetical protein